MGMFGVVVDWFRLDKLILSLFERDERVLYGSDFVIC